MALVGLVTQNISAGTQQLIFQNPTEVDNLSYGSNVITYQSESSFVLSQSDLSLYLLYYTQFFNSLLINFPTINYFFNVELPVCLFDIKSMNGPNLLVYTQTSTASPITQVYTITFDRVAKTAKFSVRSSLISISLQEFLNGFQVLRFFLNQCLLV